MKKHAILSCLLLGAGTCASTVSLAVAADYSAISRDMTILTRILETTSSPQSRNKSFSLLRGPGIEAMYLAKQGMVFNIEARGGMVRHWLGFGALTPLPPMPPTPPIPAVAPSPAAHAGAMDAPLAPDREDEMDQPELGDIESYIDEVMSGVDYEQSAAKNDPLRAQMQAKLGELRKQQQQHERQVQLQEEFLSELEVKASSGDKAQRDKARAALDKALDALHKSREQYRSTLNQFRAEQGKRWQEQMLKLQDTMLDTVCDYAGSLKHLPGNEYLTLIFRNAEGGEEGNHQVFVLARSDLDSCAKGGQSEGFLRKKALSYTL